MTEPNLTERQRKWFASVRSSVESRDARGSGVDAATIAPHVSP